MATYEVDVGGKTYEVDAPDPNTAWQWANYTHQQAAAPAAPVKDAGFSLGDLAKSFGMGAVGSTKALADVAGAENAVSSSLGDVSKSLQSSLTPERQAELQRQQERMKAAEKEGTFAEIKAGAQNIVEAPLQSIAQGIGSFVPYLPAMFAAPAAAALGLTRIAPGSVKVIEAIANAAPKVMGTAQGAGAVKSSIYDGVYEAEKADGATEQAARQKATAAQDYFGKNFDQIALGAGLGRVAAGTGVEKLLTPSGKAAAQQGLGRRVAGAMATEAPTEGAQGGQERLAQNIALQREGRDVGTFEGVAGQATQEGLMGALAAGPVAALRGPGAAAKPVAPVQRAPEPIQPTPAAPTAVTPTAPTPPPREPQDALPAPEGQLAIAGPEPVAPAPAAPAPAAPVADQPVFDSDYTQGLPPESGSFFQNRDRSAPASVGQMQSIASAPDYSRLSVGRDFGSGAPVVILDEPISDQQFGKTSTATASDGTRIPVRYAVVEGSSITPSNTADGRKNTEYGDLSVSAIRPIAGNGRVAGLQAAYSQGTAGNYSKELLADTEHGIDSSVIAGFKNPVLVRVMPKSKVTPNIADISNISGTLRLSPVESAKNDINRIDLNGLTFNDDGSPNTNTLIQFVRSMPKDEQGELIDSKGMPNTKAIDRLNNAIFYKAYGSDTLIELYAQAADPEARAVLSALAKAASKMAALEGAGDYDVRASVLDAAEMAVNARRAGQKLKDYAQQGVLGADPYALKVLDMFADNSRSSKRMAEALDRLATKAAEQANASGTDMFGDVPKMPKDELYKELLLEPEEEPDMFAPPAGAKPSEPKKPPQTPPPQAPKPPKPPEPKKPEPSYAAADNPDFTIKKSPEEIAGEIQGMTIPELARWAVDNAPHEAARAIAQAVADRLKDFGKKRLFDKKVQVLNDSRRWSSGVRGQQSITGVQGHGLTMSLKFNGLKNGVADRLTGTRYSTILHELVHAATIVQTRYAPNSKAVNDLKVLFRKVDAKIKLDIKNGVNNYVTDSVKRGSNLAKNPDELLAWGLTDYEFQKYLADIKVGDKTGFSKLVDIVRQVLGLPKEYTSALDSLMKVSEEMMGLSTVEVGADIAASGYPLKGIRIKGGRMVYPEKAGTPEGAKTGPTTEAFKKWFGDSKVVDENGEPLVVYHGTASDFSKFAEEKLGINTREEEGELGFFFTAKPFLSDSYAQIASKGGWSKKTDGGQPVVYPVYLSIKNPKKYETASSFYRDAENFKGRLNEWRKQLEEQGFDGVVVRGDFEEVIAFRPTQIKSATGNRGTYSPIDENINEERVQKPTPNQAGKEALDILQATGMQPPPLEPGQIEKLKAAAKSAIEDPAMTKASAKKALSKFLDKMETAAFSGDAAFNNDIRRNLIADFDEHPEVLGMLLEASQSQAVHSDALASQFIIDGGIAYDSEAKKWVAIKKEDNFIALAKKIDKIAEKYGLTKEQAERVAHTYFVAKRFKSLLAKQRGREADIARLEGELEFENDNIKQYRKENDYEKVRTSERAKNDIKAEIKKLKDASVKIEPDQIAMIEPGMSLAKNMPELTDISDTWQGIRANVVKAMVDGELWSRQQAEDMLDNIDYVPFYREEQLEEGGGPQEFVKGLQVKSQEYRLKGSGSPVNDVFDNMVRWSQYAINRSVRNHKALQMVDLGTELDIGDRKMAEKVEKMDPKLNTIRVFRDGKQEIYSMADPLYVDAFASISNVTIPSLKFFTWFSNLLRQSVVLYPLFSVSQVPQDAISAMFTSGLKPRYALRIPALAVKEFIKTLSKTSATHNLLRSYGATGVRDFSATIARKDVEIAAGLKGKKDFTGRVIEGMSHIAMAADNSVRQAVYEASMSQGLSKAEALEKSFDIINFRRRGTSKLINLAGQTVPFFYAYMSVQRTAYKTLTGVGISPQKRKDALMTLAATSGSVMAMALFYTMMNGGDEEYEKTPTAVRDRTLNIPGTGGLRIPLRPDLFLMPKVLTEHLYHLITDDGLSDGAKFRKSVADGIANAVLSPQPIPQAIKPAFEVAINYDFFQGRPLIGQFEKKKEAERQFNDNTSEFSKVLGQFGVSPIAADHVIRGMFGSAGGLFLYTTNFLINSDPDVPRPELSVRDAMAALPGTSGFVTKAGENALKGDFYALRDEVEKTKNTYNDIKLRSPQELEQFLSDEKNIARLGLAKSTEKIGMQLSKIRRAITQITNAPEDLYTASEKKDAIKELRDVEKEMLKSIDLPELRKQAQL
jgi:hypothetical protein